MKYFLFNEIISLLSFFFQMGKRDNLLHRFSFWSWYWMSFNHLNDCKTVILDKRYFWHLWSKFKGKMIIRGMCVRCCMVQNTKWWHIRSFKCIYNRLSRVVCIMIYSICFRMQNNMLWCFYLFANLIFLTWADQIWNTK